MSQSTTPKPFFPPFVLAFAVAFILAPGTPLWAESPAAVSITVKASELPDLPQELTSFGGAVANGKIFLYGGHTGDAHSYSTREQSDQLWMLDLAATKGWFKLAKGPRLQGLALVAHRDTVVRIGGFTAMNPKGEPHDLRSQKSVSRYDLENNQWVDLEPLPEPRSSFDAAVLGDTVYVIGGWELAGEDTLWHDTAWSLDLADPKAKWQPLAAPPFQRRALWVAAHQGKIHVIGGMDAENGPSPRTDVYDPATKKWMKGPSLTGPPMTGFGCSARSFDGSLYVSTIEGNVQRLSHDGKKWQTVATFEPGRFFHCMLPAGPKSLVLVGGANMSIGKFTHIDVLTIGDANHDQ